MPDREKVIKGLERLIGTAGCVAIYDSDCKSCPYKHINGCVDQVLKDALELLKAQEPKKAENEHEEMGLIFSECGCCHNAIRRPWRYCPFCGKAVKCNG